MVWVHPKTRQRVSHARNNTDIIIPLQGGVGVSQEKVPIIGGWTDFSGSGGQSTKALMYGPQADRLFGTNAWVDGARDKEKNELGDNIRTIRLRQKNEYIEFKK